MPPPRIVALVALLLVMAGAVAQRLRRRNPVEDAPLGARDVAPDDLSETVVEREWACECGETYRVTGAGRHRVYWRSGAAVSDPVIDGKCVSCARPLPAGDAAA